MKHVFRSGPIVALAAALALSVAGTGCRTTSPRPPAADRPASSAPLPTVGDGAKTQALLAVVQSPSASLSARARACQQLAAVGTVEAVPVLAALLGDERLGTYARDGLESMVHPEADAALRAALDRLHGVSLLGCIQAVGWRRDRQAVAVLTRLTAHADGGVAEAAGRALGRIATPEAIRVLRRALAATAAERRPAAAEGALEAAAVCRAEGRMPEAVALYDAVRQAHVEGQLRLTATYGAIMARGANGVDLLAAVLAERDPALRAVALRAARELPGRDTTAALLVRLEQADPVIRAELLPALVDRGDVQVLLAAAKCTRDEHAAVRLAAWRALGRLGDESCVPLLLREVTDGSRPDEAAAALASLVQLRTVGADDLIRTALVAAEPALKVKLIGVLGARGARGAAVDVLRLAGDRDPAISRAAFRALDTLSRPEDQPELFRLLRRAADEEARRLLERAIVVAAMKSDPPERRAELVRAELARADDPAYRGALQRAGDKIQAQAR